MNLKYCLLVFLWPAINGFSQSPYLIRPLTIGDTVPAPVFAYIKNSASIVSNRAIVLDFFATWCSPCLAALPKLDSLQKEFSKQLDIILITSEIHGKIKTFKVNNKAFRSSRLPVIAGDTLLKQFFPFTTLPHQVWISAEGVIDAIAEQAYLDPQNIRKWMAGKTLQLPLKKDILDFDSQLSFLQNKNAGFEQTVLYSSGFYNEVKGVGSLSGSSRSSDSLFKRYYYLNLPLFRLYMIAIDSVPGPNRIIRQANDSSLYCYELIVPANTTTSQARKLMLEDLNRYSNIHGRFENRTVRCKALVYTTGKEELLRSKGGKPLMNLLQPGKTIKSLRNLPVSSLIAALNTTGSNAASIVLDETGLSWPVDLELPVKDIYDLYSLGKALAPYGLALIDVERDISMFVLTDKNFSLKNQKP